MKDKVYIGIDPDCAASGFALYRRRDKAIVMLACYDLLTLFDELKAANDTYDLQVNLEAGWLIDKSNFSDRNRGGSRGANERIAKNVGANHEIGRQIEKFLKRYSIAYRLIEPAGYSSCTHDRFCKVTGWPVNVKTNSEKRVAGMLVFGY